MKTKLAAVTAALAALALAGCATHTWAPGPNAKGTFDEAKARCSLMARHSGGSFAAAGDPNFVAGAAAGAAIGNAIRAQADFNDCMSASGWVVADDQVKGKNAVDLKSRVAVIAQETRDCVGAVRRNPKYAVLEPHHTNLATGRYSLVQMSDTTTPTAEEASLLAAYGDETAVCQDKLIAQINELDPRSATTLRQTNARIAALVMVASEPKVMLIMGRSPNGPVSVRDASASCARLSLCR